MSFGTGHYCNEPGHYMYWLLVLFCLLACLGTFLCLARTTILFVDWWFRSGVLYVFPILVNVTVCGTPNVEFALVQTGKKFRHRPFVFYSSSMQGKRWFRGNFCTKHGFELTMIWPIYATPWEHHFVIKDVFNCDIKETNSQNVSNEEK